MLCLNSSAAPIADSLLPDASTAALWYTRDLGTVLSAECIFGQDPFQSVAAKEQCEAQFSHEVSDLRQLLNEAVNGNQRPLQSALQRLIQLTSLFS